MTLSSLWAALGGAGEKLANAWLATGASAFSLWQGKQLIAAWPRNSQRSDSDLSAIVYSPDGDAVGEVRVAGLVGHVAQSRLEADAMLLTSLSGMEEEVDGLAEALGDSQDQLLALYELTRAGSSSLDIDKLLRALVRQAARLVKADAAFAVLIPSQVMQYPAPFAGDDQLLALFERVVANGGELLLNARDLDGIAALDSGSVFLAPLPQRDRPGIVAALGLWLDRPAAELSPDLKLARSIAEQAGAQLEIALMHQELLSQVRLQAEMELARQVQMGLLPRRAPNVEGISAFGESRPALRVGGDFYDFYPASSASADKSVPAARLPMTFAVGDISGKGMPAALLMAMTRTTLRGGALSGVASTPEAVLAAANEDLYDDFTEVGMMATVFVGCYDPTTRILSYANAGHSPVIYCPAGGTALLLEADGPAMGVLSFSLSLNQRLLFSAGDLLIVGTDGFNEAANAAGEMFGIERLLRLIEQLADRSASEIARELFSAVGSFSAEHPQDDDQTVVVIKGE